MLLGIQKKRFVKVKNENKMKLQYASDLHLEFPENSNFLMQNKIVPKGDILLLAGDIVLFERMDKHDDFFQYLSDNFQATYWVPGNHEYYYFDAANKSGTINEKIKSNVFLVNNTSIIHDNVKLIFSTLWTKIGSGYEMQIESGLNDFHVIKYNSKRFSARQYNNFHIQSIDFIKKELEINNDNKTIVVSHHVPTFYNYPEQYKGSVLNEAFAVELFNFIEIAGPDYWIYGHNHFNQPDFKIGHTKIKTNQLGYVRYNEHLSYKNDISFKV